MTLVDHATISPPVPAPKALLHLSLIQLLMTSGKPYCTYYASTYSSAPCTLAFVRYFPVKSGALGVSLVPGVCPISIALSCT
jgi:hypothetical protein